MRMQWICLGILAVIPIPALSSDWVPVTKSPEVTIFADRQSLKVSTNAREIWIKYVYKQKQKTDGKNPIYYYQWTSYQSLDCQDNTYAIYESVFYGKTGEVLYSSGYSTYVTSEPVIPDSYGETTLQTVCAMYKSGFTPAPPAGSTTPQQR